MSFAALRSGRAICWWWLLSRAVMLAVCFTPAYPSSAVIGDVKLYDEWGDLLAAGRFPAGDERWQYPPLAALPILLPRLLGGIYGLSFMCCAIVADSVVLRLLLRRGRSPAAAWFWLGGIFLLGPVCFFRYDIFVVVPVVLALLPAERGRLFGALAALGALMKVWPVLLFLALRRRDIVSSAIMFGVVCAVVLGGAAVVADGTWAFWRGQRDRGIEIEALVATPFHVARWFGWPGEVRYQYGSWELVGPGVSAAVTVSLVLTVGAFGAVALGVLLRRTPSGSDAVLAGVFALVAGSRVLSPQYLVWVAGVIAVCLATATTRQRPVVWLTLAAITLTHLEFPIFWTGVCEGEVFASGVLVLRNLLLLAATVMAIVGVWRRPVDGPSTEFAGTEERRPLRRPS